MAHSLRFETLDVFTTSLYAGNPLAVIFLDEQHPISQTQKQQIAREFNLSETIFIHPANKSTGASEGGENEPAISRKIDIFMTNAELPFAGHPTIGAASWFLLHSSSAKDAENPAERVKSIITKAGEIPISISAADPNTVSALIPHNVHIHSRRLPLATVLQVHPSLTPFLKESDGAYRDGFPIVSIVKGMTCVHVGLPNLEALAALSTESAAGSISPTAQSEYFDDEWVAGGHVGAYFYVRDVWDDELQGNVIRSRMLDSTLEDPATGSAASGLACYLTLTDVAAGGAEIGDKKPWSYDIVQGVEMGKRSVIGLRVALKDGGKEIESVELSGSAVRVSEGSIRVE
ncbi:hypothetical protein AJ80_07120 [Polytolypa hystricis UAMH7299]|uniref:Phenazine biosynthesis protein n=1 Tax=Polytolypa hystricis (strain UAMH7299) TaxID=1447883 RepID=A0A2B7XRQ2_POLH7|nr:hypothetical protein AJ80_07120 [Polytolypa hystricis UAMH7299]